MKKTIYSILLCSSLLFATTACDDSVEDPSKVTYFAELTLKGDEFIKLNVGEEFTEPGYTATEGEEDITDKVKVSGSVDEDVPGFYTLSYSVANKDGFSVSSSREVMVINPNGFASAYQSETTLGSNHFTGAPIVITDNGDGTFMIDDLLGGFQFYGLNPGFEPTYDFHAEAVLKLNADNSITLESVGSWSADALGVTALDLQSGTYDPATGTVSLTVLYTTSKPNTLTVTLTK